MTLEYVSRVAARIGRELVHSFVLLTLTVFGFAACTRAPEATSQKAGEPMVLSIETHAVAGPSKAATRLAEIKAARSLGAIAHGQRVEPSVLSTEAILENAQPAISGDVVFARDRILGRTFLYGSDLQYSAMNDPELEVVLQSMAVGHVPANFKIVGKRLQLIMDQSHLFESNINRPGRLLHEWPIVAQDEKTVTVRIRQASPVLATVIGGAKAPPARSTWVRSIESVAQGDYLLIETSVEHADGAIVEYMESVFPRETLVPSDAKVILADAEREPLAERFRFLSTEPLFLDLADGRVKTKIAQRFPVSAERTVDWYVTPNIPAEYLSAVQAGIEGWNRYSQKMWGRDFMKFKGIVPAGVKIGDPRYNIINWDSVAEAGAAYESQASDPLTGLQSHSLIYLPYAWVNIGKEYWQNGGLSQIEESAARLKALISKGRFLGRPLEVGCFHEVANAISLEARRTPEDFAIELLKQVLFHEAGHALGLAHNFKGSLSNDPLKPGASFSTTIMDYNQYQLEDGAYEPGSASGPLLEYDRQILSALYNDAKDISESDPVLPACADDEADSEVDQATGEKGVDPLCIRYDAGEDPTKQLVRTLELVRYPDAKLGRTRSFPATIAETVKALGDPATVKTEAEALARLQKLATDLQGVAGFYYDVGAQGLSYMLLANLKSLFVFRQGVLPAGMDEKAMRDRVASTLLYVASLENFEPQAVEALSRVSVDYGTWLSSTPWILGLTEDQKSVIVTQARAKLGGFFVKLQASTLMKVRARVFQTLRFSVAPFYFNAAGTPAVDYERLAIDVLETAATTPLKQGPRAAVERKIAADSLRTFGDFREGAAALARVKSKIDGEVSAARTTQERDEAREILKVLNTPVE